jgi:hypothetical protein
MMDKVQKPSDSKSAYVLEKQITSTFGVKEQAVPPKHQMTFT